MKRHLGFVVAILFLLAACTAAPEAQSGFLPLFSDRSQPTLTPFQPQLSTSTIHPTVTARATYTPTVTFTPTFTPTPAGCQETSGALIEGQIQPVGFAGPLEYLLYLPPCYAENAPRNGYPLLTMLHGQTYTPQQWLEIGLTEEMDRLLSSRDSVPFLVLMPYESPAYEVGFHRAIINELIPALAEEYAICTEQACQAIGGISRGGGWALTAVFRFPEQFISLGLHSVPVSESHLELVRYTAASVGAENLPRIYLDFGESDYWYTSEQTLVNTFNDQGIPFSFFLNEGSHDNEYWSAHLAEYLQWYAAGWE